jgi:hypothetical protein
MLGQQALLRVPAARRLFGFPDGWPFKRVLPPMAQQTDAAKSVTPFFERLSQIAAGDLRGPPKQRYLTTLGLRDPGVPLPPPDAVAVTAAAALPAAAVAVQRPATELLSQRPRKGPKGGASNREL